MINKTYQNLLTDDQAVQDFVSKVLKNGYIALDDFLDEETKAAFHQVASDRSNGNKKNEALKGTPVYELAHSADMLKLSQRIYDARCALTGETKVALLPENQFVGMPYKDGRAGTTNKETAYHYDGAYSNWLLPLVLPTDQSEGDGNLIMFPNIRQKYPKIIGKLMSRLLRHSKVFRSWYGPVEVVYQVDTMYFFFGDISFHGVEPISNGERLVVTINSHW
jgi:hypothetical protein